MKIVIHTDYGCFGLSEKLEQEYAKRKGLDPKAYVNPERNCPVLVQLVEEAHNGIFGEDEKHDDLSIVEIPDDVQWQIEEYDGAEWVAEKHRTWR